MHADFCVIIIKFKMRDQVHSQCYDLSNCSYNNALRILFFGETNILFTFVNL